LRFEGFAYVAEAIFAGTDFTLRSEEDVTVRDRVGEWCVVG
jgi:hypothetical protein